MLLNFSRGGLVCRESLREALAEKRIARYITDFPDDDLLSMENVTCIPHLGASTRESETNCALMAVRQVKDYLENGNITNSVNFPGCRMDRSSKVRIAVAHRNIPNMLGQISGAVARKNINILNMVNRGKGDYAYTLMDVDEVPGQEIIRDISCIEGILAARMIVD
ncbi:MAG: phosphoglycerate dehydrogenase [Clostridia bacterium]